MSEKSFPYKSVNKDRMYGVQDWREYFATFIGNGVFYNPSTNLQILAYSGMTVVLKSGKAFYNGTYYNLTEDVEITIDTAEASLNRRDDVVIQFNDTDRKAKYIYRKGTPSANPAVNNLQRNSLIYEIRVASIYVGSGVTQIDQQNITDTRLDNEQCGIVHGLIDQVDTETIFNQYEDWWRTQTDTTGYLTVAGDNPSLTTDNKKVLGSINETYAKLLNLINTLTQDTGAGYINAVPIQSGGATTVQGIVEELLPKSGGTITGNLTVNGSFKVSNPSIAAVNSISHVTLEENKIFKIPGATVFHIHGKFDSASDGIPSNGSVGIIPSGYRPSKDYNVWCFAQTNDLTVIRATATLSSNGRITVSTQNSKSFRWFRIEVVVPQGA